MADPQALFESLTNDDASDARSLWKKWMTDAGHPRVDRLEAVCIAAMQSVARLDAAEVAIRRLEERCQKLEEELSSSTEDPPGSSSQEKSKKGGSKPKPSS